MSDPFKAVRDFESALCAYTGAPFAVTATSCTMALLLAVAWHLQKATGRTIPLTVEIPKRTYVGVPMSIIHAGGRPTFRDEDWTGCYQLKPLPVWDAARWFTSRMYRGDGVVQNVPSEYEGAGHMVCVSFHWSKTLGIQQGGAILHDDPEADVWLRLARFDGREEGVAPKDQQTWQLGWHAYMSPETAAAGLVRLSHLPRHNDPLPNDQYPDLSELAVFR